MKSIFIASALVALGLALKSGLAIAGPISCGNGGGSPFSGSGTVIQAIFNDDRIWHKVFGAVEEIQRVEQTDSGSRYRIQTTEYVPIKNENDITIGYQPKQCVFFADVTVECSGPIVKTVDFSNCPI